MPCGSGVIQTSVSSGLWNACNPIGIINVQYKVSALKFLSDILYTSILFFLTRLARAFLHIMALFIIS